MRADELYRAPNALAGHYSRFRVAERCLLTGHSHQAWPDRGFDAHGQAWLDAAEHVDEKWPRAFEQADRVRDGFARLLSDHEGDFALAANTHELVVRFLSALPLADRPRIVTTDGEFHTLRRQLDRLEEEGIEVVRVAAEPVGGVAERLIEAVDERTAAVAVSSVFFETAKVAPELGAVHAACRAAGVELLVDVYHTLNAVPFSVPGEGLEEAFVVGGGYKYCQLGEGNCFLRVPPGCTLRPVVTGWFSEFGALADDAGAPGTVYGDGAARFAGATYDPTSHYRAAAVFDFFADLGLTPELLREVSRHQVGLLAQGFDRLDADPRLIDRDRGTPLEQVAGFLVLRSPAAAEISAGLRRCGVLTDYRGTALRLGPAPYLADEQLDAAIEALAEVLASRSSGP